MTLAASAVLWACGGIIVTHPSAEDLANRRGFQWDSVAETPNFTVYYEAGLRLERIGPSFEAEAETSWADVHRFLAEAPTDERVTLFVVDSRDRMQTLTGLSVSATGFARTRVVCIVAGERRPSPVGHELLHVIAMNRWGTPERWANEGLATAFGGRVRDYALHDLAKYLLEQGSLPALATMIERFPSLPARLSYPAAGSFVLYLRDVYGLDAIRRVWQQGSRALPEITGAALPDLENGWLAVVRAADAKGITYDPTGSGT